MKGNHAFTAQSTVVEDHETEDDSDPKPDKERETESPAEGDAGMTGEISDVNLVTRLDCMQFANAVELYQKKEPQLLWVW